MVPADNGGQLSCHRLATLAGIHNPQVIHTWG
jgi:hypothetical protein